MPTPASNNNAILNNHEALEDAGFDVAGLASEADGFFSEADGSFLEADGSFPEAEGSAEAVDDVGFD